MPILFTCVHAGPIQEPDGHAEGHSGRHAHRDAHREILEDRLAERYAKHHANRYAKRHTDQHAGAFRRLPALSVIIHDCRIAPNDQAQPPPQRNDSAKKQGRIP